MFNKDKEIMLIKEIKKIERLEDNKVSDNDMNEIQKYFDKPLIHNNDINDFEWFILNGMNW